MDATPSVSLTASHHSPACTAKSRKSFPCHTYKKYPAKSFACHTSKKRVCKSFSCHTFSNFKWGRSAEVRRHFLASDRFWLSPLESALTQRPRSNSFRISTYGNMGGGSTLSRCNKNNVREVVVWPTFSGLAHAKAGPLA